MIQLCGQNAVRIPSEFRQNPVRIPSESRKNAVSTAVRIPSESRQNPVSIVSASRQHRVSIPSALAQIFSLELGHRGVLQSRWVQKVHRGGVYFEVYGGCAVEFI